MKRRKTKTVRFADGFSHLESHGTAGSVYSLDKPLTHPISPGKPPSRTPNRLEEKTVQKYIRRLESLRRQSLSRSQSEFQKEDTRMRKDKDEKALFDFPSAVGRKSRLDALESSFHSSRSRFPRHPNESSRTLSTKGRSDRHCDSKLFTPKEAFEHYRDKLASSCSFSPDKSQKVDIPRECFSDDSEDGAPIPQKDFGMQTVRDRGTQTPQKSPSSSATRPRETQLQPRAKRQLSMTHGMSDDHADVDVEAAHVEKEDIGYDDPDLDPADREAMVKEYHRRVEERISAKEQTEEYVYETEEFLKELPEPEKFEFKRKEIVIPVPFPKKSKARQVVGEDGFDPANVRDGSPSKRSPPLLGDALHEDKLEWSLPRAAERQHQHGYDHSSRMYEGGVYEDTDGMHDHNDDEDHEQQPMTSWPARSRDEEFRFGDYDPHGLSLSPQKTHVMLERDPLDRTSGKVDEVGRDSERMDGMGSRMRRDARKGRNAQANEEFLVDEFLTGPFARRQMQEEEYHDEGNGAHGAHDEYGEYGEYGGLHREAQWWEREREEMPSEQGTVADEILEHLAVLRRDHFQELEMELKGLHAENRHNIQGLVRRVHDILEKRKEQSKKRLKGAKRTTGMGQKPFHPMGKQSLEEEIFVRLCAKIFIAQLKYLVKRRKALDDSLRNVENAAWEPMIRHCFQALRESAKTMHSLRLIEKEFVSKRQTKMKRDALVSLWRNVMIKRLHRRQNESGRILNKEILQRKMFQHWTMRFLSACSENVQDSIAKNWATHMLLGSSFSGWRRHVHREKMIRLRLKGAAHGITSQENAELDDLSDFSLTRCKSIAKEACADDIRMAHYLRQRRRDVGAGRTSPFTRNRTARLLEQLRHNLIAVKMRIHQDQLGGPTSSSMHEFVDDVAGRRSTRIAPDEEIGVFLSRLGSTSTLDPRGMIDGKTEKIEDEFLRKYYAGMRDIRARKPHAPLEEKKDLAPLLIASSTHSFESHCSSHHPQVHGGSIHDDKGKDDDMDEAIFGEGNECELADQRTEFGGQDESSNDVRDLIREYRSGALMRDDEFISSALAAHPCRREDEDFLDPTLAHSIRKLRKAIRLSPNPSIAANFSRYDHRGGFDESSMDQTLLSVENDVAMMRDLAHQPTAVTGTNFESLAILIYRKRLIRTLFDMWKKSFLLSVESMELLKFHYAHISRCILRRWASHAHATAARRSRLEKRVLKRNLRTSFHLWHDLTARRLEDEIEMGKSMFRRVYLKRFFTRWLGFLGHRVDNLQRIVDLQEKRKRILLRYAIRRWRQNVMLAKAWKDLDAVSIDHFHRVLLSSSLRFWRQKAKKLALLRRVFDDAARRWVDRLCVPEYERNYSLLQRLIRRWKRRTERSDLRKKIIMADTHRKLLMRQKHMKAWRRYCVVMSKARNFRRHSLRKLVAKCFSSLLSYSVHQRLASMSFYMRNLRKKAWMRWKYSVRLAHTINMQTLSSAFSKWRMVTTVRCHLIPERVQRHSLLRRFMSHWTDRFVWKTKIQNARVRHITRVLQSCLRRWHFLAAYHGLEKKRLQYVESLHNRAMLRRSFRKLNQNRVDGTIQKRRYEAFFSSHRKFVLSRFLVKWKEFVAEAAHMKSLEKIADDFFHRHVSSTRNKRVKSSLVSTRRLLSMIGSSASKTTQKVPSFLRPQLKKFEYEILLDCMQRWRRFAKFNHIEEGIVENLDRQRRFRIVRNAFNQWVKRCEMFSRRRKEDILFDYFRKK